MNKNFIKTIILIFLTSSSIASQASSSQSYFMGEIRLFGNNFCPRGWLPADGRELQISQYSALFSIIGTIYGGNGRTAFALPDLRGKIAINQGQGPGLSNYRLGNKAGLEEVNLSLAEIPEHNHNYNFVIKEGRGVKLTLTAHR